MRKPNRTTKITKRTKGACTFFPGIMLLLVFLVSFVVDPVVEFGRLADEAQP